MTKFVSLILVICLFVSCGGSENDGNNTTDSTATTNNENEKMAQLKSVYAEIEGYLISGEVEKIKKFFYNNEDILVVENPGVFIVGYFTKDISTLENLEFSASELKMEALPTYNMEMGEWSKEGCFASEVQNVDFEKFLQSKVDYLELEVPQEEFEKAKKYETLSTHQILLTFNIVSFYFTYQNNQWYITAIDMSDFSA
jgi:hypothetical protein